MGIETAALLAAGAGAAGGTAATAAGVGALGATAAGTAAAGATAAGAAGAGLAAGTTAATAAGAAGAAGAGAAASGAGAVAGSLEAANLVGAIGGDALGAFISANQGFGTMTAAESIAGMGAALESSPYVQALQQGMEASNQQPEQQAKQSTAPAAYEQRGPNQNPSLTQQSSLMQQNNSASSSSLDALGFADGGIVPSLQSLFPDNIFARTNQRREQEAGLAPQSTPSNITINVGGQGQGQAGNQYQPGNVPRSTAETPSVSDFANSVLQLIRSGAGYEDGGQVRTGSSDVKAGGEIRGPQSKSGRDNQIIKVAGGEGILPVDVMDVPGVADLVQSLISTFHKPVK